jgi:hypothetical protein
MIVIVLVLVHPCASLVAQANEQAENQIKTPKE